MGQCVNLGVAAANLCWLCHKGVEFCLLWGLGCFRGMMKAKAVMHTGTGTNLNSYMLYCLIEVTIG